MAKKNKKGGVVVEVVIDPDVSSMERLEQHPHALLRATMVTSKAAAERIIAECTDAGSALLSAAISGPLAPYPNLRVHRHTDIDMCHIRAACAIRLPWY